MITEEERKEIIAEAVEQVFLMLPETVGNLMVANAMYSKLTKDFYDKFTEFKDHKNIVQTVVRGIEGSDPTKSYSDILAESVPKIKSIIENKKGLSMNNLEMAEVDLCLPDSFKPSDNGLL